MSQDFERRLAEALAGLDQGKEIDSVLMEFPDEADELAPLLEAAAYAREALDFFEPPSVVGLAAGRRRMLEAAARKRTQVESRWWESALAPLGNWLRASARGIAVVTLLLALLGVAGGATVVAAADSLPGDVLYPVKRAAEQVRLVLATDPAARAELQMRYNRERQAEAQAVAVMGRRARLRFEGMLERRLDDTWIVDGIQLVVEPAAVEGEPVEGSLVVVDVISPGDGTLHAEHMTVHGGPATRPGGGPMHEPSRPVSSRTPMPTALAPAATVLPTAEPTSTHAPMMPMPTEEMEPGQHGPGPQPEPTHGGSMMEPPTASPQPPHGSMGPGMGMATPTPAPTEESPAAPTQSPPSGPAPPTNTPAPEPTHHGPMMPHPTQGPQPTQPPPGGGHHGGGPGGRHGP